MSEPNDPETLRRLAHELGELRRTVTDRLQNDKVREKAFDAFFTTKHRGTGLGLPIAKRVIDAHGGTIQIDSPPSGGTTISVGLPLPR